MIEKNWMTLIKPKKLNVVVDEHDSNIATLVAEPLEKGFGLTLGTALRRVLLSSLQGCAPIYIKIDGVQHEFSSVPGCREDVTDIILNLKGVYFKALTEGQHKAYLKVKGPAVVTAGMIETSGGVEVMNKDVEICTWTWLCAIITKCRRFTIGGYSSRFNLFTNFECSQHSYTNTCRSIYRL